MVYNWLHFRHPLWRPRCALCGLPHDQPRDLCPICAADLPRNTSACATCGAPLNNPQPSCGGCQQQAPAFERVLAPFLYASPIDRFILELKFRARLDRARLLGELLGDYLSRHGRAFPECVIPVPLHRRRLRERGYNQALELARPVSRMLDIPLQYHEAVRIRATAAQSDLDLAGRKRNVHGAFALAQPLKAKHVAIMDDVITTGHTANELARCLRRGGVQTVEVWALARA